MARARTDPAAPLQPIKAAARLTGWSEFAIRKGCKNGTIPHVMIGTEYRVHLPLFLAQIAEEAAASVKGCGA